MVYSEYHNFNVDSVKIFRIFNTVFNNTHIRLTFFTKNLSTAEALTELIKNEMETVMHCSFVLTIGISLTCKAMILAC